MIEDKIRQKPLPSHNNEEPTDNILDDPDKWNQLSGNQIFVLKKETIMHANQELNKKLSREYQASKVDFRKKNALLKDPRERVVYDYESYPEKKEMYALREMFAKVSKSNELMKANHEDMKKRVERISKVTQMEDALHLKEGEIAKYTLKLAPDIPQSTRAHQVRADGRNVISSSQPVNYHTTTHSHTLK